jgi:branched-chain amino acid transport system permease protein
VPRHATSRVTARSSWVRRVRLPTQPLLRHLTLGIGGALLLLVVSVLFSSYNDFQLAQVGLFVVAIAGLTVLVGASGQVSLGNGAFMAVGAYVSALVLIHSSLPLVVSLLAAVAAGTVAGVVIGIPASRLRGPYLAGMTLALAVGLPALAVTYSSILGGDQGLTVNPPVPPGSIDPQRWLAWIVLAVTVIVLILLANLLRSRFGRAFRAVRDDEVAAELVGIVPARARVAAFAVSAACAGLAGALLALTTNIVSPTAFDVTLSIQLLAGMVVGGTGSLLGAWWGGILLVYVPQWSSSLAGDLGLRSGQSSNLALLFYGVLLIAVMLVAPEGIQGVIRRGAEVLRRRWRDRVHI